MAGLHPLDYVVFGILIIASIGIGMYHAFKGSKTTSDYLVGNRNLGFFPVSMSFTASLYSAILVIGVPAETYTTGGMNWLFIVGMSLASVLACVFFVPVFYPLKITSINTYLTMRFRSKYVGLLGTIFNIISMVPVTSVVTFGPALTINALTNFPVWASILLANFITITYTSIGGIKAVIWTDVFQLFLMIAGMLAVCIEAIRKIGDLGRVMDICGEKGRLNFLDFNPDPTVRHTFWSLTIGIAFLEVVRYGIGQASVQRYSSLPSITQAYLCVLSVIPLMALMVSMTVISGLAMFAYYDSVACDPLRGGLLKNANQLIPYFAVTVINVPSVPGLLLAGITAASLSSASSLLNACAANLWNDVILIIWPAMSEKRSLLVTKLMVVVIGAVSTALCFVVMKMGGTLITMVVTLVSAFSGPTGGLFLLGLFFPCGNWIGAATGAISGLAFALWIGFGAISSNTDNYFLPTTVTNCSAYITDLIHNGHSSLNLTSTTDIGSSLLSTTTIDMVTQATPEGSPLDKLYAVSYLWVALFSAVVTLLVGLVTSLMTGCSRGEEFDQKFFHPLVRRFLPVIEKTPDPSFEELLSMKNGSNDGKKNLEQSGWVKNQEQI